MNREKLGILYKKYQLNQEDVYKHKHYLIITRTGIDKIQAMAKINVSYDVIESQRDFCIVKATGKVDNLIIETFGSALYGGKEQAANGKWIDKGTTTSWYIMEMAEKRAMARCVLKLTGFYSLGVFSEDESDEFQKKQ